MRAGMGFLSARWNFQLRRPKPSRPRAQRTAPAITAFCTGTRQNARL